MEALLAEMPLEIGDVVYYPKSFIARHKITEWLYSKGVILYERAYYTTLSRNISEKEMLDIKKEAFDFIILTSPSIVRAFFYLVNEENLELNDAKIISIGPKTTREIIKFDYLNYFQAKKVTAEGLVNIIIKLVNQG